MDGGLLRVTRAKASEPGWALCVTSDLGHSKFHVLREPGLIDSESESIKPRRILPRRDKI